MKEEYRIFARNLTAYMKYYGFRQTALAKQLGIAPATVAWWCHGERLPRFGKMVELTELFHCTQDDLLRGDINGQTIQTNEYRQKIISFSDQLTEEGLQKVVTYLEDLNPKYYKNNGN